jgi:transketolase C-terminal domain/subunit
VFFDIPDYKIVSLTDQKQLAVVCEATTRVECEDYLRAKRLAECDVFKESGEEIYRGICPVTTVKSAAW